MTTPIRSIRQRMQIDLDNVLIVGCGRAGVAAAEELTRMGYRGEITLLGDEPSAPYDRPAVSKRLLDGRARPTDVRMPVDGETEARVRWALGRRAVHLDPVTRTVGTDTGEAFEFDGLIIASGARAAPPKTWPIGQPGIHTLYTVDDAWGLRQDLRNAGKIAVVGAGLTGCEAACTMRNLARDAVLVDSKPMVLSRAVGELVGTMITEDVEHDGVQLRLGRRVADITPRGNKWRVSLNDGEAIDVDLVIASAGEKTETAWLENAGLDISDGVLCDEYLRVLDLEGRPIEGVVAAGTVARWPNLRYSAKPQRIGQWIAALEHGRACAHSLLGDLPELPVTVLPRYWSEQFGLRIQVAGVTPPDADISVTELRPGRHDVARSGVLVSYYQEGRVVGLVGVNAMAPFNSLTRALLVNPQLVEQAVPEPSFVPQPVSVPQPRYTQQPAAAYSEPRRRLSAVA
jgi:NADPH-dependent 2,4-dienoyl-CoA reductase/sulfur reductase-like enzyme